MMNVLQFNLNWFNLEALSAEFFSFLNVRHNPWFDSNSEAITQKKKTEFKKRAPSKVVLFVTSSFINNWWAKKVSIRKRFGDFFFQSCPMFMLMIERRNEKKIHLPDHFHYALYNHYVAHLKVERRRDFSKIIWNTYTISIFNGHFH